MNAQLELYNWIKSLEAIGLTQEEIEGCLDFYEEEWQDLWEDNKQLN
jgi:hypothetical protein